MKLALGLALALFASIALNVGFYVQHEAASGMPVLSLRRPFRSLWLLFSNLKWFAGWAFGWLGWGLYIGALAFAPLSLAQALVAGGVGIIAVLAWVRGRAAPSRLERRAILACLLGLAFLALSLGTSVSKSHVAGWPPVAWWVGACVVAAGLIAGPARAFLAPGAGLGAAAGLLYAGGDIATKGAVTSAGLVFVPVLIGCHVLGFVALQLAFQRGRALSTAGLSTVLNNVVPIAAGVVVFGEHLPGGPFGAFRVVGFTFVVLGAALLARPEAGGDEAPAGSAERADRGAPESRRPSALDEMMRKAGPDEQGQKSRFRAHMLA